MPNSVAFSTIKFCASLLSGLCAKCSSNFSSLVDKYQASLLQNGDIIIADAAEDETVGKCSEIAGLTTEKVLSGLHTIPCRPVMKFSEGYLGYCMNSEAYHDQLLPLIQGTKISSIDAI